MKNLHVFNYKHGDVAYIRTTEEPVFILNINEPEGDSPGEVTVRRPVKADTGVEHRVDFFLCDELATHKEIVEAQYRRTTTEFLASRKFEKDMRPNDLPLDATPTKGPMLN